MEIRPLVSYFCYLHAFVST